MVSSISKGDVAELPQEVFPGKITVVNNELEAIEANAYLKQFAAIGFDTETRPSFKKGVNHKIALMQLSSNERCFLFRLNTLGFPDSLVDLLTDPSVKKIGLSLKDDFAAIRKSISVELAGFIELQSYVKKYGIEDNGLRRIYGILFGKRISKGQRLTNWEDKELTEAQQMYAALDSWACLRIYDELQSKELKSR